ncbi:polysaccharide biosynthesis tyrosine autokinase [Brumimicrobium salinarum]|uniref:polysaccharide biosynthesis tyrosine autokinase n=1 Tax=Brumimicrobium salinarum TaxID=2058658 RepID=UPI00196B7B01|nr:tyrosine-protein kinase [Brumimicrobium salinarum]
MNKKKLFVNTTFDTNILKIVIKRNWYWCVLIFSLFIVLGFLYLRYTKPVYESRMLIQINSENQGADLLDLSDVRTEGSIAKEIELLRSQLLFKKAIKQLPLQISLYAKGEFLTEQRYRQGNLEISPLLLKDSSLLNTPINITTEGNKIFLNFTHQNKAHHIAIQPNEILKNNLFDIKMKVNDFQELKTDAETNQLYFVFNDLNTVSSRFHDDLSIRPIDQKAKTVEISYRSHSPTFAKDIITALTKSFFKYDEGLKKESAENVLGFIASQLDSLTRELSISKDSVMRFQRNENITNPEHLSGSISSKIEFLRTEERNIIEEIRVLKVVKEKLNSDPNSNDVYRLIPNIIGQSYEGSLTKQIQELYELIERKEDLSYKVTQNNDIIQKLEKRITIRKESITRIIDALIERTEEKLKITSKDIKELENRYFDLPEKQMELDRLINIQELNEKYYSLLNEKKVIYSISNAGYASNNKILNSASSASSPVFPVKSMVYSATLFLAFSFSIGLLLLRYLTFNQINQITDLNTVLPKNIGVLGSVSINKAKAVNSSLIVNERPKSAISESFRTLRTNLSFVKQNVNTIAITSTISGEGKTFIALNLAGIIAMSGKSVLVIDLDMRKPKVHLGFGSDNIKGMSNLLAKHCTVNDVIQHSQLKGLDFISAGPIPPNPSELLLSQHFEDVFKQVKTQYDTIIFDNPPVGLVSDGIQLLSKVDVPIYVFRANFSKRYFVEKLKEISEIDEINNINIVLNAVDAKSNTYGGNYGGYYSES